MENLYLYINTAYRPLAQCSSGFSAFYPKDVSVDSGCIHRVLPSTLRYLAVAAQAFSACAYQAPYRNAFLAQHVAQ
jgi:hypothetical protein